MSKPRQWTDLHARVDDDGEDYLVGRLGALAVQVKTNPRAGQVRTIEREGKTPRRIREPAAFLLIGDREKRETKT